MTKDTLYNPSFDYVSWISNVSGRLFFHLSDPYSYRHDRIIGDVLHLQSVDNNDNRIFFISMLADLRDYVKKSKNENYSKYTRIIISSKVENNACVPKKLEGYVYLIDDKLNKGLYKSYEEVQFIKELELFTKNKNNYKTLEEIIRKFKDTTSLRISMIKFQINESGIIYLKKDDNLKSKEIEVDADVKMSFFILKFVFHKDRYHSTSQENIVRVISYNKIRECICKKQSFDNKELLIAKELLDGVKKYIAEKRRNNVTNQEFLNLKGVVSYAKSLTVILDKVLNKKVIKQKRYSTVSKKNKTKKFIEYEEKYFQNLEETLDREIEKLPKLEPKSVFSFLKELKELLFIPLLLISVSLLSARVLNINMSEVSFKDIIDFYIFLIFSFIFYLEGYRMMISSRTETYLLNSIIELPINILKKIKKHSNPTLAKKYNIGSKLLFPYIINIEMFIRRASKKIYLKIISSILLIITVVLVSIYIFKIVNAEFKLPKVITFFKNKYSKSTTQESNSALINITIILKVTKNNLK